MTASLVALERRVAAVVERRRPPSPAWATPEDLAAALGIAPDEHQRAALRSTAR